MNPSQQTPLDLAQQLDVLLTHVVDKLNESFSVKLRVVDWSQATGFEALLVDEEGQMYRLFYDREENQALVLDGVEDPPPAERRRLIEALTAGKGSLKAAADAAPPAAPTPPEAPPGPPKRVQITRRW